MGDFTLEAELPGTRPPPGWGERKDWRCPRCLCKPADDEEEEQEEETSLERRANTCSTLVCPLSREERRRYDSDVESVSSNSLSEVEAIVTSCERETSRICPVPSYSPRSFQSVSDPDAPFLSLPTSSLSSRTSSLPSSLPSTLLLYNPDCPVHACTDDRYEDVESKTDDLLYNLYKRNYHPFKVVVTSLVDMLVDLTSQTKFAAVLQTSQLYWDTTAGINQMDANCRVVFPLAFALINVVYWPTYMYLL